MSLDAVGTGILRRHIGRRFGALRAKAGLTQEQAAKRIQRGKTTLIRLEDGDESIRFRDADVQQMLDVYGANQGDREWLLALTAATRNAKKGWWHDYTDAGLPEWFGLYVILEDSAVTIRKYESAVIPGLLQTPAYAELLARTPEGYIGPDDVRHRVEVRMERQSLLTRTHAPQLHFIVNEAVIRAQIGDPGLMAAQLERLNEVARLDHVRIQVLPTATGINAGMIASHFTVLTFPDDPHGEPLEPPLVYVDTLTGALYLHKSAAIDAYELVWRDLEQKALSTSDSEELILNALQEVRG